MSTVNVLFLHKYPGKSVIFCFYYAQILGKNERAKNKAWTGRNASTVDRLCQKFMKYVSYPHFVFTLWGRVSFKLYFSSVPILIWFHNLNLKFGLSQRLSELLHVSPRWSPEFLSGPFVTCHPSPFETHPIIYDLNFVTKTGGKKPEHSFKLMVNFRLTQRVTLSHQTAVRFSCTLWMDGSNLFSLKYIALIKAW